MKARTLHTEESAKALKGRSDFRRAFALNRRDESLNCREMIRAGFGDVRPSDIEKAAHAGAFPHSLWAIHYALTCEMYALKGEAWRRWGEYVADELRSEGGRLGFDMAEKIRTEAPL